MSPGLVGMVADESHIGCQGFSNFLWGDLNNFYRAIDSTHAAHLAVFRISYFCLLVFQAEYIAWASVYTTAAANTKLDIFYCDTHF